MIWKPDTCGCVIQETNEHVVVKIIKACQEHPYTTDKEHYQTVLADNQNKNIIVSKLVDILALKDAEDVVWNYVKGAKAARVLEVSVPSKTLAEVSSALTSELATEKVLIK